MVWLMDRFGKAKTTETKTGDKSIEAKQMTEVPLKRASPRETTLRVLEEQSWKTGHFGARWGLMTALWLVTWIVLTEDSIWRPNHRVGDWTMKAFPTILLSSMLGSGLVEVETGVGTGPGLVGLWLGAEYSLVWFLRSMAEIVGRGRLADMPGCDVKDVEGAEMLCKTSSVFVIIGQMFLFFFLLLSARAVYLLYKALPFNHNRATRALHYV